MIISYNNSKSLLGRFSVWVTGVIGLIFSPVRLGRNSLMKVGVFLDSERAAGRLFRRSNLVIISFVILPVFPDGLEFWKLSHRRSVTIPLSGKTRTSLAV
jgi:hypothetical protein